MTTTMANARHSSETFEYFTPPEIVDAARRVLGTIDMDPASSAIANEHIRAKVFYDMANDGYCRGWRGNVFLNPPGGLCEERTGRHVYPKTKSRESCTVSGACGLESGHRHEGVTSSAKAWWFKLAREIYKGHVGAAIFVGFSLEILQTTQVGAPNGLSLPLDASLCFPARRLAYLYQAEDGTLRVGAQPTHSSFLAYVGPKIALFKEAFSQFGKVIA